MGIYNSNDTLYQVPVRIESVEGILLEPRIASSSRSWVGRSHWSCVETRLADETGECTRV